MQSPTRLGVLLVVLTGCTKGAGNRATDSATGSGAATPAASPAAPSPASTLRLADVTGTWALVSTPTDGKDRTPMKLILRTTDTTRWTETMAGHPPVVMHVRVEGDSIVTHSDPHDSFRRRGVKVTTDGVWRLDGGKLVGVTVARYAGAGGDSVLHLRSEATKTP
jgi:hypothetical protein